MAMIGFRRRGRIPARPGDDSSRCIHLTAQPGPARPLISHLRHEESPMTKHAADTNRRRFIKLTVTGLAAAPLANAMFSGSAEAADMLSESDPTAVALKYKMDATKAPDRKDATAFCNNCNL